MDLLDQWEAEAKECIGNADEQWLKDAGKYTDQYKHAFHVLALISALRVQEEALHKLADSDYWQEHRYPGTSGMESQRNYIPTVFEKVERILKG